jgi:hypothetical protein
MYLLSLIEFSFLRLSEQNSSALLHLTELSGCAVFPDEVYFTMYLENCVISIKQRKGTVLMVWVNQQTHSEYYQYTCYTRARRAQAV